MSKEWSESESSLPPRRRVSMGPRQDPQGIFNKTTTNIITRIVEIYVISVRGVEGDELVSLVNEQQALLDDLQSRSPRIHREVIEKLRQIKEKRRAFRLQRGNND